MADPAPGAPASTADLPSAKSTTGKTCSLACNLPHGLTIVHAGRKLVVHGGNHPKAIQTGLAVSARWGITHDVDEEWYDDWVKTHNVQAVRRGLIMKNTAGKIVAHANAAGDSVKTGVDKLDPEKPKADTGADVEKKTDED